MTVDQVILRLIEKHEIPDQFALLKHLAHEGFDLTQSTLSRHLKKLSVQKREGRYQRVEPQRLGMPAFTLKEAPPNLLVLTTTPGFAQAMAELLDQYQHPAIAGTLAGDNTVFIALADMKAMKTVQEEIREILNTPR
ncbi:MAG: arginine repressor [Holophagaceae bacterium]|nr:arginine repressor [Holophagaceae bacterium]